MIDDKTRGTGDDLRARGFKEEPTPRGSEKYHKLTHALHPGFFTLEGQVERTRLWYSPTGTMQIFLEAALAFSCKTTCLRFYLSQRIRTDRPPLETSR
jgi:hypothetical protein